MHRKRLNRITFYWLDIEHSYGQKPIRFKKLWVAYMSGLEKVAVRIKPPLPASNIVNSFYDIWRKIIVSLQPLGCVCHENIVS